MKNIFAKLSVVIKSLGRVEGQDLVEYALVVALIAFAATAGMKVLASDINVAFSNIGVALTTAVS
jgi:pilus assembly protein Flp/PilA